MFSPFLDPKVFGDARVELKGVSFSRAIEPPDTERIG
jgi:hypothetical protein